MTQTQSESRPYEQKWKTIIEVKDDNWHKYYTIPFAATTDVVLRHFQFNYIKRLTATNKYRLMCKLQSSSLCDFCNSYVETIEHLFWECTHTQSLWNELRSFLSEKGMQHKSNFAYN